MRIRLQRFTVEMCSQRYKRIVVSPGLRQDNGACIPKSKNWENKRTLTAPGLHTGTCAVSDSDRCEILADISAPEVFRILWSAERTLEKVSATARCLSCASVYLAITDSITSRRIRLRNVKKNGVSHFLLPMKYLMKRIVSIFAREIPTGDL